MENEYLEKADNIVSMEIRTCHSALGSLESMNALEILEWAGTASLQDCPDEWVWLTTKFLGLPSIHALAVQEVLKQGRWRRARDPKSYVKVCAKREIRRQGLGDDPAENFHLRVPNVVDDQGRLLTHDAYLDYLAYAYAATVKTGGSWKHRNPDYSGDWSDCDEDGTWLTPNERLLRRVPAEFKKKEPLPPSDKKLYEYLNGKRDSDIFFPLGPVTKVNWRPLATKAGLDRGEYYVLLCKVREISRERAVAKWKTARKRKWVEAAWRRFNRTGLEHLRAAMRRR